MPNWCYNTVELHHDDVSKIDALESELQKDDAQPLNHLRPNPAGEWDYGWSVDNWGTKWDVSPMDWERISENRIRFNFDSAWSPPITIYEWLESEGWSVSALYHEPGMVFIGRYEDGFDDYYEYDITDRESIENIPEDLVDFGNLLEDHENWVEENYQESIANLERTEWFPKKVKPTMIGRYEVKTKAWPYPNWCNWTGEKWERWEGDDIKVTEWRGLVENPDEWDAAGALDEIMADFDLQKHEIK